MSKQRLEFKVGVFVFICLVLMATLMIFFSKNQSFFKSTYHVYMKTSNVGGLKPQAKVLMSGVEIGTVGEITLSPDGRAATIALELLERYKVYKDALFTIDSLGFLGDQYVGIKPTKNEGQPIGEGEFVEAKEPFDLQELARASLGFVNRLDATAQRLSDTLIRVDKIVLNEQNLTNLSMTMSNLLKFSDQAIEVMNNVDAVFKTNSSPLNLAISNLVQFSEQLNTLADELNATIVTNRTTLTRAVNNLDKSSSTLNEVLTDVNAGRGPVGALLKDDQLKLEMSSLFTNLNTVSSNLTLLSSNINSKGLWSVLWKPKPPKPETLKKQRPETSTRR